MHLNINISSFNDIAKCNNQYDIDMSGEKPKLINQKEHDTQIQMEFDG